jgi:uncharacterized protein YbjT (DUF2867 family)
MSKRTVLVLGATGNQGGAVARALLGRGHTVHAFVRNPDSDGAKALAELGATLVQGSFDDGESIANAAQGVDAVFVNTSPFVVGIDGEVRHGRTIIDALTRANVPHVVYSSVSDADRNTGIPHFDSKADAEAYLKESGLPATVTAPVFFSDNITTPWTVPALKSGVFAQAMPGDRQLQVVSVREIGEFNATIIERGPELAGQRFNYASDELTPKQMADALQQASGLELQFVQQPIEEMRAFSEDMALMYEWFDKVGYTADIQGLRDQFPEVDWKPFTAWSQSVPWEQVLA